MGCTRGAALPFALLATALLMTLAGAGFTLAWQELRTARAHLTSVRAFYAADGGLQDFLGKWRAPWPRTATVPLSGAVATVASRPLVRVDPFVTVHHLVSTGRATGVEGPYRRRVESLALTRDPPRPPAALAVDGSLGAEGGSGLVSGSAAGGNAACPDAPATVAGLARRLGEPDPPPALMVLGSPSVMDLPEPGSAAAAAGIAWQELFGVGGLQPDLQLDASGLVAAEGADGEASAWPVVVTANGETARMDDRHSGQGTLVVRGDAHITGPFAWRGLVLVGGSLRVSGELRVDGALLVGLDPAAADPVADLRDAHIDVLYDPCAVMASAARLVLAPASVPGSWTERVVF